MIFEATADGRLVQVQVRGEGRRYVVRLDGREIEVDAQQTSDGLLSLIIGGESYELGLTRRPDGYAVVSSEGTTLVQLSEGVRAGAALARRNGGAAARVTAPMPGKLLRVLVEPGDEVAPGQGLVVMEAMKMENELRSPRAGRVQQVEAREGAAVETGALLVVVE